MLKKRKGVLLEVIKTKLKTFAKINLCLDIIGKREDGYHNLSTIMQMINLFDEIELTKKDEITVKCEHPSVPEDESNLAYKAAKVILTRAKINCGVEINIMKNIPVAAGLAGGSTNAAGVLLGLNYLYNLNFTIHELIEMAKTLGADVPFCLIGGTVLATGIGDRLKLLPPLKKTNIILVNPAVEVSTKDIYSKVNINKLSNKPDIDRALIAIEQGDIRKLIKSMGNVLEPITEKLVPEVADIKKELLKSGADNALLCGSGPSVFAICIDSNKAKDIYNKYKNVYSNVFLCNTI